MSVKVAIRVRPFNQRQKFLGCVACVQMRDNTTVVFQNRGKDKKQHYFTFDYSFWSHDGFAQKQDGLLVPVDSNYVDQKQVYALLGQQILENAWVGFNCCLFAYGQTGAGKSYSMIGYGANKGIIPMACEQLFQRIKRFQKKGQRQYQVTISMLQIYNEKVQDLFINTNKRPVNGLKIRQNKALGVYVQGLNKYPVFSYSEIQKKMEEGSKNRSLASTLMNEYSSRAHTIVMLEFIQKQWITKGKMTKKTSLINLVDLAGSERVSKTGVGDNKDRLKEASLINKSLHTLGRVIEALADQCIGKGKNIAIPYRQSALTRILENALGGNSKTTMICAISPANDNCEETLSTLRYADKTKKIKNKPVVNQSEVDKLIRQLREQNERLKKLLDTTEDEKVSPTKGLLSLQSESERKEMKSNVRASMREIQRQIRKNLQSFAINTDDVIDEADNEESLMMTQFIDLEDPSLSSEFQTSFTSTTGKSQAYITNLNEDELLNFKVKYSCERNLLITNTNSKKSNKIIFDDEAMKKVVLCGLGIEENHAKIVRENQTYFIEALSQSASEYTLLNGKPVFAKQELKHNDRIILGTNSVFLFKNLANTEERPDKKYTSEKGVGYEFAINERQQQMENEGVVFQSKGSPSRKRPSSQIQTLEDKELLFKLEEIERQFSKMLEENEKKTREKQQKYKLKLLELQREKQLKQAEKNNLQQELNQKKQETYKLRTKELQIEKLQKKLAKFEAEKNKRKLLRESLLLDGLDSKDETFPMDEKQLSDPAVAEINFDFGVGTEESIKNGNKKRPNKTMNDYFEVVVEQYDEKDEKSALGTTNTNSIQIEQSQFLADDQDVQNKMKKNNKKAVSNDQQTGSEIQELQRYNKIVKIYLDKIKVRMCMFTKLYDITIYSQKLSLPSQQLMQQFDCQLYGGVHFCKHCKKVIDSKTEQIQFHQNHYQYHQVIDKQPRREIRSSLTDQSNPNVDGTKQTLQTGHLQRTGPKYQSHLTLNKSNLSDLLQDQSNLDDKSRKKSDSMDLSDESLLLNGTNIDFEEARKTNRSKGENQNIPSPPLSLIPEALLQESRKVKIQDKISSPKEISRSSFALIDEEKEENSKVDPKANHFDEEGDLKQYIPHQDNPGPKCFKSLSIWPQKMPLISFYNFQKKQSSKPTYQVSSTSVQTDIPTEQEESLEIRHKKPEGRQVIQVDFDFSVSDIEEADHENSIQQSLNFSSLNSFKEQELTKQIQLLKQKINKLEVQNSKPTPFSQQQKLLSDSHPFDNQISDTANQQMPITSQRIRKRIRKYNENDRIKEMSSEQETDSPQFYSTEARRLAQLPQEYGDKDFLRSKIKKPDTDLEKELQSNLLVCNNQNIINQRNINIRKRKRQVEELKKNLIKKQKIQLQKQLFVLIPMIERFNLLAKEMNRLIEAKVEVQYRNFSHYEIIEALKNFTKSKWKKNSGFSNVQIKVVVANLEEARIYKWPVEVFKNRFQIAEEVFQKYIENNENSSMVNYNTKDNDKSKDPFWDPIDFVPSGVGYLSIQCLLYNIGFEGQIKFVSNSKIVAKAFVSLQPVIVKRRNQQKHQQEQSITIENKSANQIQIFNPRNYLQKSIYFTLSIESVNFTIPDRQHSSPPVKFNISYELLVDDYKIQSYTTPEIDFKAYQTYHDLNYLRRHSFNEVSESTLAYISDCPIKISINLMKDYSEECLNTSFNQDLERSIEQSSVADTSFSSNIDITRQFEKIDSQSFKTPDKQIIHPKGDTKVLDFSKKQKKTLVFENTELLQRIDKDFDQISKKRQEKRKQLLRKQTQLKEKKQKLKNDEKECLIY